MKRHILIFFTGSIGDTLTVVPLLDAIRQQYLDAVIELFYSAGNGTNCAEKLLIPVGFVDKVYNYTLPSKRIPRVIRAVKLIFLLRRRKYDEVIYLIRSSNNFLFRTTRDRLIFKLAGIKIINGLQKESLPEKKEKTPMGIMPHHITLFADRLTADGIIIPAEKLKIDLKLTDAECRNGRQYFTQMNIPPGSIPIAIGIGGKKQVCRWPLEKYRTTLLELIKKNHVFPVFFGGKEDIAEINALLDSLPSGFNAVEICDSLRETIALMGECAFYLGNDTGTLHMAVAAGLKCVGIYSSHNHPGIWYPFGEGHIVLRNYIDCEVCLLQTCYTNPSCCINSITEDQVLTAACNMIEQLEEQNEKAV